MKHASPVRLTSSLRPSGRTLGLPLVLLLGLPGCLVMQKDHDAVVAQARTAEQQASQARAEVAALRADLEATRQRPDNALRASADSSTDMTTERQRLNALAGKI